VSRSAAAAATEQAARRPAPAWVPSVLATVMVAVGLLDIAGAFSPRLAHRLHRVSSVVPGAISHASPGVLVAVGVLLLFLANAIRRRKRRAWRLTVALLTLSLLPHVVYGLNEDHLLGANSGLALVSLALLVALVVARREFYAIGDPYTRWRPLGWFLGLSLLSVGLGLALAYATLRDTAADLGLVQLTADVVVGLVGVPTQLTDGTGPISDVLYYALLSLGLVTICVPAYMLLRSPRSRPFLTAGDEADMRALIARHGERDSLGYFALRRDKSVVFSPTRKAAIAYRVTSGVMLASGDPLGDPEAWPGAIAEFLEEARLHAWVPGVVACSQTGAEIWCREAGLVALEIGDEAVVEVDDFSLDGRSMRNVRQMCNRVRRAGYTTCVRRMSDVPAEEMAALAVAADHWRVGDTERGFSMALGRLGDPADEGYVVVTASLDGEPKALLGFVPWGRDGLSLDLMRRDQAADPGLSELLIVETLQAAPRLGVARVSLNFAAFRSALARGERIGASPITRAWRSILVFVSRWAQIESLYRFNAKFGPVWEPRFILYPDAARLPRVSVAYLEAEAFISYPRLAFWRGGSAHEVAGLVRS